MQKIKMEMEKDECVFSASEHTADTEEYVSEEEEYKVTSDVSESDDEKEKEESNGSNESGNEMKYDAENPLPKIWNTWEALHNYIHGVYADKTFQIFNIRRSNTVEQRNKEIMQSPRLKLIPDKYKVYSRTYVCIHGPSRGSNCGKTTGGIIVRPKQNVNKLECRAKICAVLTKVDDTFKVRISQTILSHNHSIDSTNFQYYPKNRRIVDQDLLDHVEVMVASSASKKKILAEIRKRTEKKVTQKDVRNLINKIKLKMNKGESTSARLQSYLVEFAKNKQNTCCVFNNDIGKTGVITVQTGHMKKMMQQFPETILVDATHNTNMEKYKLFSFMISDAFGFGQYVQHAVMRREDVQSIRQAIIALKEHNTAWNNIKVIVVDKDFVEIAVMRQEFPHARILLCQFHVIKYLNGEIIKATNVSMDTKETLKAIVTNMVYADNSETYDKLLKYFEESVGGKKHPLFTYFLKNWDQCKEMWVRYMRGNVPHMGNNTNNRIEASWGSMKNYIHSYSTLDDTIIKLIELQQTAEEKYNKAIYSQCKRTNVTYDKELLNLLDIVSFHATELI